MNARFGFACAAAGIAMTTFGATTASADEGNTGSLGFFDNPARPGQEIGFFGSCDAPDFVSATLASDVLVADEVYGTDDGDGGWKLNGQATVVADAQPGSYDVSFQCGTTTVTAPLTIEADEPVYRAIGVQDDVIKPGQEVTVVASCQDEAFTSSTVASDVLTAEDLVRKDGDDSHTPLFGTGHIAKDAKPGTYQLSFTCAGETVTGDFVIVADQPEPGNDDQVPVKPKGPADTGSLDAPAGQHGADTGLLIGAGVALAVTAGGAGALAYRRRQQES